MASSKWKTLALLVISLASLVISLPATVALAATAPSVEPTDTRLVTEGVRYPLGVVVDAASNYYVADQGRGGVLKFNKYGKLITFIKTAGVPQRVALTSDGRVIVSEGTFVAVYNNNGSEDFRLDHAFSFANGITLDSTGNIYVVDTVTHIVYKFNPDGSYANFSFGQLPFHVNNDYLTLPTDIAFEKSSNQFAIANTGLGEIEFYNIDGTWNRTVGHLGGGVGTPPKFTMPQGIAFDYTNDTPPVLKRMYVVDVYQSNVQAVDPAGSGTYLAPFIGSWGTGINQLIAPTGAAFDPGTGCLVVANGYGNLTLFAIDGGKSPIPMDPSQLDQTKPNFTVDVPVSNVTVPNLTLTGTRGASDVEVYVSVNTGARVGATTYGADNHWSCDITGLASGRNDIAVKAVNSLGNSGTAPVMSVFYSVTPSGFAVDSHPNLIKTNTYDFTGTATGTPAISVNGTSCGTPDVNGRWTCSAVPLSEGVNQLVFTVTGTSTATFYDSIEVDTTPPVLNLSALDEGSYTSTPVQNISGTVSDTHMGNVTVTVNEHPAQTVAVSGGAFSFPVALDQSAGATNTIQIVANDTVGNSTTVTRTYNLDMSAPAVAVALPADGSVANKASTIVSGSVDRDNVTCSVGLQQGIMAPAAMNTQVSPPTWQAAVNLNTSNGGVNTILVQCTDAQGKVSSVKRTVTYNPNMLNLAVTGSGLSQDQATNASAFTIQGTVDSKSEYLTSNINGTEQTIPMTNGTFSFVVNMQQEGSYPVLMTTRDSNGNISSSIRTLIYDVTPPALNVNYVTSPVSTGTIALTGTVEPGSTVSVTDLNGTPEGSATIHPDHTWTTSLFVDSGATPSISLADYIISATDPAGNVTQRSAIKPDGDFNENGGADSGDLSKCLDIVSGVISPTKKDLAHGDIGPLKNIHTATSSDIAANPNLSTTDTVGDVSPNGQVDLTDCVLIARNILDLPPYWYVKR